MWLCPHVYTCGIHVYMLCMYVMRDRCSWHKQERVIPQTKICHPLWSNLHTYHMAQGGSHTTYVHTSGETKKVYRLTKSCQLVFWHFILCWLCWWLSNIKIVHLYYFFVIYPCLLLWNKGGKIWEAMKSRKVKRWDVNGERKYLRQKTGKGLRRRLLANTAYICQGEGHTLTTQKLRTIVWVYLKINELMASALSSTPH